MICRYQQANPWILEDEARGIAIFQTEQLYQRGYELGGNRPPDTPPVEPPASNLAERPTVQSDNFDGLPVAFRVSTVGTKQTLRQGRPEKAKHPGYGTGAGPVHPEHDDAHPPTVTS
ncbi:MAG: hypothetical protein JWQ89_1059 [Devosia sp.]|nr:hypothetical protein [Devosia sp.]